MNDVTGIQQRNAGRRNARGRQVQRWGALVGGGALAVIGLTRRSPAGFALAAAGGALAYLGAKNGSDTSKYHARASVVLNCSPEEAYNFWRRFEDLPVFMRHLDSVTKINDNQYRWRALGPLGVRVQWDAEIVSDEPNQLIAWRSLPGSELNIEGSVRFQTTVGNRGTLVEAETRYVPPAGALGRAVSKAMGKDPKFLMQQDLRRFKALVETGEIPTTEGQTHGPRSAMTAAARWANPDQPIRRESKTKDVLTAMRRIA
jgi:uncharacterized membrane protein